MVNRRLCFAAIAAACVLILAACSRNEEGNAGKETEKSDEPVKLVFYSNSGLAEQSFNELYGEPLTKKFPNMTVEYIRKTGGMSIQEVITAGKTIDVYFESIGGILDTLVNLNLQYDMSELLKKYNVNLSDFEPAAVDAVRTLSNGKMYGLPVYDSNRVLYYNKDIFNRFGVPYPKDGMSWDDAILLGNKMTRVDNGRQYVGLAISKEHQVRMNALSAPLVDPKTGKAAIMTDPRWMRIMAKGFVEPYRVDGYQQAIEKSLPTRAQFYNDQNLAMYVYLSNMATNDVAEMKNINWDMVSEPHYKELPGVGSQTYPTFFSVTGISAHKEQAMRAIAYLTTPEHQSMLAEKGIIPILTDPQIKKKLGLGTTFKDKNFQAIFYNKVAPIPYKTTDDYELEKIYLKNHLKLAKGSVDLNTALRQAEEEANKLIEANKK